MIGSFLAGVSSCFAFFLFDRGYIRDRGATEHSSFYIHVILQEPSVWGRIQQGTGIQRVKVIYGLSNGDLEFDLERSTSRSRNVDALIWWLNCDS